jgi:hypothetical protein
MSNRYDLPHLTVSLVALIGGGYLAARYPDPADREVATATRARWNESAHRARA